MQIFKANVYVYVFACVCVLIKRTEWSQGLEVEHTSKLLTGIKDSKHSEQDLLFAQTQDSSAPWCDLILLVWELQGEKSAGLGHCKAE